MTKDHVLSILKYENNYVSGEEISRQLGISRAAVNTAVKALRANGYDILSSTNKGYLLASSPDTLTSGELSAYLDGYKTADGAPRSSIVECYDSIDSTNKKLKELGDSGAPEGYVVIANEQTKGRGRRGKEFNSPKDHGVYLSYLLRPAYTPNVTSNITAWAAVAVSEAIKKICKVDTGIKWVNDLVLNKKKVCGILTELSIESESSTVSYIVIGIGINVNESKSDFPKELKNIATSLKIETGKTFHRAALASEIIKELDKLKENFPGKKDEYLKVYREHCVTVGQEIKVVLPSCEKHGTALSIGDDFELWVKYDDSYNVEAVSSGDVSVRGLYNYA